MFSFSRSEENTDLKNISNNVSARSVAVSARPHLCFDWHDVLIRKLINRPRVRKTNNLTPKRTKNLFQYRSLQNWWVTFFRFSLNEKKKKWALVSWSEL